jgi:hypothetical protein
VPVALKAGLVNNPPADDEGRLYREIARSKPAPQGICVANSAGKVLAWALMFDDDKSVRGFLDYTLERFSKYPAAQDRVAAERYMRFPSSKLADIPDAGQPLSTPGQHAQDCPANPPLEPGTIRAQLFGRALGEDGKPVANTIRQEHYVEDRFNVPVEIQTALIKSISNSGTNVVEMPAALARLLISHAFLGQLDVNPVGSPAGGKRELNECTLWVQRTSVDERASTRLRIAGTSHVKGSQNGTRRETRGDGRLWEHEVKLTWDGLIDIQNNRITRLLVRARGSEKLRWDNPAFKMTNDVACLPGGHPIDLACEVRYGIIGEPVDDGTRSR